ncbi:hypothetical protein BOTBODRAFT_115667, partial [Botryobasidium botryosum FD-172 SS1]
LTSLLPDIPGVVQNRDSRWQNKYRIFQEIGWEVYSHVSAWPSKRVTYIFADADVIKELVLNKTTFPKPGVPFLEVFGANVVAADDDEWRRHRKISAPAFSERNNKLVWSESLKVLEEIFAEWGDKETVTVENIPDLTLPIALHVISAAGFGRRVPWREDPNAPIPSGHKKTFKAALAIVCDNLFLKATVPEWAMGLTKKWAEIRLGFHELETYMQEMIRDREGLSLEDEEGNHRSDLFSSLLAASQGESASGKPSLTSKELVGNIFIFLLAGHETTAHSLAFTFGLLACYPDEQQKLYDHITSVVPEGRLPSYEDVHSLTRALAVLYEAMRLYPPVGRNHILAPFGTHSSHAARDATLSVHASVPQSGSLDPTMPQRKTIVIPKGSALSINIPGVHYNPRYWEDPYEFKPDRFLGNYNKDAFIPFAIGARACLGKRFSEVEAVGIITMMVLRYKIELNPDRFAIIPGETPRATQERLLKTEQILTLAPERAPLAYMTQSLMGQMVEGFVERWCVRKVYPPITSSIVRPSLVHHSGIHSSMALLTTRQLLALFAGLFVAYTLEIYRRFRSGIKAINNFPGARTLLSPTSDLASLLPDIPGVIQSRDSYWQRKYKSFQEVGWEAYSYVSAWPMKQITYTIADADAIKEVGLNRVTFPKMYQPFLRVFGANVVAADEIQEEWKRHRKISAPAFSERNNKLVWNESVRVLGEIFAEWGDKEAISVENMTDLTLPIALYVISAAGFGRRIPWREDRSAPVPSGHKITFKAALLIVCDNLFLKAVVPEWAMGLKKRWTETRLGFHELKAYMREMIKDRDALSLDKQGHDLFSSLLSASQEESASGEASLTSEELMGNIFIFLLAGHETTAHSLAFSLGLLACYPEEQQKLHDHITSVILDGRLPSYEDIHSLNRVLAVLYETLRLFPPAVGLVKQVTQDTTLSVHASVPDSGSVDSTTSQRKTIVIPKGSALNINAAGLHYNPRYWEDPYEFKPDRFLGKYNKDAFVAFAVGARACLGRRFSEVEIVAIITMMLLRYKVELNPEHFTIIPGETSRATRERLLKTEHILTLAPERTPLLFRRRV